ncbi:MAG TPA: hypothetical protein VE733_16155 [Streptosporangiaceae bacterium]|nr:hypothetical protein [Streptosporangiaceae bacterium]
MLVGLVCTIADGAEVFSGSWVIGDEQDLPGPGRMSAQAGAMTMEDASTQG